jgi:hypothetical protein
VDVVRRSASASARVCAVLHAGAFTADVGVVVLTQLQEHPANKRPYTAPAAAAHHVFSQGQRHHCRCDGRAAAPCACTEAQLKVDGPVPLLCATFTRSTSARAHGARLRPRASRGTDGQGLCLRLLLTVCPCSCSGGTLPVRCRNCCSLRPQIWRALTPRTQMTNESRIFNASTSSWASPPIVVSATPLPALIATLTCVFVVATAGA